MRPFEHQTASSADNCLSVQVNACILLVVVPAPGSPQKKSILEVNPLKYCPRCNFTFADFHHVCDFDGAELSNAPEPPSLGPRRSLLRRCFKSPVLVAVVGLCAVVSSAFLIGYFEVVNQPQPIAQTEPSLKIPSTEIPVIADSGSAQPAKTSVPPTRSAVARSNRATKQAASSRTIARFSKSQTKKNLAKSELVQNSNRQEVSQEKDPMLTAMLKTTWRLLKKPFKF